MTRVLIAILMLGCVSTYAGSDSANPSQAAVPEIVVSLAPAEGILPLDASDQAAPYRFFVIALDRDTRTQFGSDALLVRLGQKRAIEGSSLRGSIDLRKDGSAKYSAEFLRGGKIVARTSATVRIAPLK